MYTNIELREFPGDVYHLVQSDYELRDILEFIGLPKKYWDDITGAVLLIGDGEYLAVWLTEYLAYYDLSAVYHPLPYYRPTSWKVKYLPYYWHKWNIEYR